MGTPEIARVILEKLHSVCDIVAVFAQPDRPAGRGHKLQSPPVALYAKEHHLPLHQPEKLKTPEMMALFQALSPDYIVVAAYGRILPEYILTAAKRECLNVHASLLPKYRGAAPINYSLLNGDTMTGVSIMRVVKELDAGAVFLTKEIAVTPEDDAITLTDKMAHVGADAVVEAIAGIEAGNLNAVEQEHSQMTYAHKLSRELAVIDFSKSARDIVNQVRALVPWPVASATLDQQALKVYGARQLTTKSKGEPGEIVHLSREGWTVVTGDGDLLIHDVQLHGKRRMPAFDLANGLRLKVGVKLQRGIL